MIRANKIADCVLLCFLFMALSNGHSKATLMEDIDKIIDYGNAPTPDDSPKLRGEVAYGKASWYGSKFQGRKTSNGEKFNKNELTAAHKTLPFNTKVRVTNMVNKKAVVVRINDRGPFRGNRIIDLSEKAAEKIDMKTVGTADIKMQIISEL